MILGKGKLREVVISSSNPQDFDLNHHTPQPRQSPDGPEWDALAATPEFKRLIREKKAFIIPALLLFLIFTLSYPLLAGLAPHFMSLRVFGEVTVIYIYSITEFFVGWLVAWRYAKAALRFDESARAIVLKASQQGPGE